jgi:uncharacterized damage-inducible protein DinB
VNTMMDKATLDLHLAYTNWATRRLLNAAAAIPAEQLVHNFNTADRNIVGTLAHVFAADRIWLDRVNGRRRSMFIEDRDRDLSVLESEWPALHAAWRQWLENYNEDLNQPIAYHDMKGNLHQNLPWQIILHVVNHGTHHRGQVSGFLRVLGHTPPPLDLIVFYRGL